MWEVGCDGASQAHGDGVVRAEKLVERMARIGRSCESEGERDQGADGVRELYLQENESVSHVHEISVGSERDEAHGLRHIELHNNIIPSGRVHLR